MPKKQHTTSIYSVHPSIAMVQKWIDTLKAKTGRSLPEWLTLVKKEGPPDEKDCRDWLKTNHGLGTNSAWWIAERAAGKNEGEGDPQVYLNQAVAYVEAMYAKKPSLRPIHDNLIDLGRTLGNDVKICPCQTIVPLYRNHVFAQVKPSTNTRIDFGLALAKFTGKIPKRLVDTGGKEKKDRITHRVRLTSLDEIDAEVKRWMRIAYDLDV